MPAATAMTAIILTIHTMIPRRTVVGSGNRIGLLALPYLSDFLSDFGDLGEPMSHSRQR